MNILTPFVSTHFRWIVEDSSRFTYGKVYKIEKWYHLNNTSYICFQFFDDRGELTAWTEDAVGLEDYSYEGNLKEILG